MSYCYTVPTYAILGLATAYLNVTPVSPRPVRHIWDRRLWYRLIGLCLTFLVGLYVFVRIGK